MVVDRNGFMFRSRIALYPQVDRAFVASHHNMAVSFICVAVSNMGKDGQSIPFSISTSAICLSGDPELRAPRENMPRGVVGRLLGDVVRFRRLSKLRRYIKTVLPQSTNSLLEEAVSEVVDGVSEEEFAEVGDEAADDADKLSMKALVPPPQPLISSSPILLSLFQQHPHYLPPSSSHSHSPDPTSPEYSSVRTFFLALREYIFQVLLCDELRRRLPLAIL